MKPIAWACLFILQPLFLMLNDNNWTWRVTTRYNWSSTTMYFHKRLMISWTSSSSIEIPLRWASTICNQHIVRSLFNWRCRGRDLIIERQRVFLHQNKLTLNEVLIIFLNCQKQLLSCRSWALTSYGLAIVVCVSCRHQNILTLYSVLFKHLIENLHIFLYSLKKLGLFFVKKCLWDIYMIIKQL